MPNRKKQSQQNKKQITDAHIADSGNNEPDFFIHQKPAPEDGIFISEHYKPSCQPDNIFQPFLKRKSKEKQTVRRKRACGAV